MKYSIAALFAFSILITSCTSGSGLPRADETTQSFYTPLGDKVFSDAWVSITDAVHSLMILKDGEIVYERYANGHSSDELHIMWSVSKSFTAFAVGLAAEEGLLDIAPDGGVYDWQAYGQSNGMSATVYLRDPGNKKLYDRVYALLNRWVDEGNYGFTRIYTAEQAKEKYGIYGPFSFMVATDGKTSISEKWLGNVTEILGADEQKPLQGTHGYEPELGPQPVFLGRGPAFREGAVLPRAQLMDIAPTLAQVLGQELPEAEGRCLHELLK